MKKSFLTHVSLGRLVLFILFALCLTANVNAQGDLWWFEPFNGNFPHPFASCPSCGIVLGTGSPPQTHISYAINGYTGNNPNRDPNLSATLTGGRLMGGNYEDSTCDFNTLGYGTIGLSTGGSGICTNADDTIKVTFSQPVRGQNVRVRGKYPQTIVLTEDGRPPQSFSFHPVPGSGGGEVYASFSGKKMTGFTVKSTDPQFAFSLGDIMIYRIGGTASGPGGVPPSCPASTIARPAPADLTPLNGTSIDGWTMRSEISDAEGLVLTNVRLNGRLMAERISVPYYNVATGSSLVSRGELRPNDSSGPLKSRLVAYRVLVDDERLTVEATYAISELPQAGQSCLSITQRYEFGKVGLEAPCEPSEGLVCQKYRALVSYKFTRSGGDTFRYVDVAQRNHFKVNDAVGNSVALFEDCEDVRDCLLALSNFKDKKNPLFTEYYSPVIIQGNNMRQWDNMHQTFQSYVTEPSPALSPSTHWITAGCPECLHTHWRWGADVSELDHFGRGKLLIPSGSNQDMSIGIARYRSGEERPNDFRDLVYSNPEPIRSSVAGSYGFYHYNYTVPENVVYWLKATGYKTSDEFFSYYSFFNPSSPNQTRSIEPGSQPFVEPDGPTSIKYAHLFEDGDATYTEIDPNTVAQMPPGYTPYFPVSHDIRTEAEASGPHTVAFNLPSVTNQAVFENLRILHSEPDPYDSSEAIWVDRTILPPDSPAPDFANRKIYAKVNHVGPFLIANYTAPPLNTNVADLSVSISDSADPVTAENQMTYVVTVANNGLNAATDVVLSNGLPSDVLFDSVNSPQGSCRREESTVMCKLGTIASGANVAITIAVRPFEGPVRFPESGKTIVNTAFVFANENDPDEVNNSDSESTNALPNPNKPPTVKVESPGGDAIFSSPASLTVIVGATDSDGSISQVQLFLDDESVGNGTLVETGKYSINLSNLDYGEHTLVAIATDDDGRQMVSDATVFFVNGPIQIDLDTPVDGALFARPASVSLIATAVNPSGTISQVEFFADGLPIGNGVLSGTDEYTLTWNSASTGVHLLRAVATDGNGVKSRAFATEINVTNAPVVSIVSPPQGTWYPAQSSITFTANASDFDGPLNKVDFYIDSMFLGKASLTSQDTYTFTTNFGLTGARSITAKATDAAGYTVTSAPVNIVVSDPQPPTDLAVWRPSNGTWYIIGGSGAFVEMPWGVNGDRPVPGDYDGDGVTDFSVFRPSEGKWYIINSSDGVWSIWNWGVSTDINVPADFDGDGKTDPTIYRPSTGEWYFQGSSMGYQVGTWGGNPGDVPAPADFDGDGKADMAVWRPSTRTFHSMDSGDYELQTISFTEDQFGDKPVPGDYDGDGKADYAVYNSTTGYWHLRKSASLQWQSTSWGEAGDIEVHNDYNGDGRVDFAVWRPSNGTWYIWHFGVGTFRVVPWGENGDTPVPAYYNR